MQFDIRNNRRSSDIYASFLEFEEIDLDSHLGHRDRLRRRVAEHDLIHLPPHETLEFLLYFLIPRQNVNDLAHALIEQFGSLDYVLRASVHTLRDVHGIGLRTAQWLALLGDVTACFGRLDWEDRPRLSNLMETLEYACELQRHIIPPSSIHACLDINDRLLYQRRLTDSRAWGEPLCLRTGLADVLENQATGTIIFQFVGPLHAEPDEYDISRAAAYADVLAAAQSRLTDVIIIGEGSMVSMRQRGLIPPPASSSAERYLREDYLRGMPDVTNMSADQLRACLENDPGGEDG